MNIKIQQNIMEENQHYLYVACEAFKCNFVVTSFWFLFWNCLTKWTHLFLPEQFPIFLTYGTLMGRGRVDGFITMMHCAHRRYPKTSTFFEILLLCCPCKNISCSITRLAMFYLKHLYSKTLDVSVTNRDWSIFS